MKPDRPLIAIVIPAYRVANYIKNVLVGIPESISIIIIVDDCSPDNTTDIVKKLKDSRIHLVSHQVNQGVGKATFTGYLKAVELGAGIIVKIDGDDQMDPAYLPDLLTPILMEEADYTKGNRFLHYSELGSMPVVRRIGNAGLSILTKLASGYWNIFDPTNGYTAINAKLVPLLKDADVDKRFFFETSMLIELGLRQAVVQDVYIPARYNSQESSLSEIKTLFHFPPRLLKGFIRRIFINYYFRDFGLVSILLPLGFLMILFGVWWGLYYWIRSAQLNTFASTGTVMLGVLPLILGAQFLLQAVLIDIQNVPKNLLSKQIPEFIAEIFRKP